MNAIATPRDRSLLRSLLRSKESAILLALVIMVIVIALKAPESFLNGMNIYQVSRQVSFIAIVALGELFVILTGGIDLSVGSIMGWSGIAAAWAMTLGIPWSLAFLFGILAGVAMGAINGALIAWVRIPPFIATLGMLQFAYGNVLGFTKGWPITELPKSFLWVAQGSLLGMPVPVWIALLIAMGAHVVLTYTAFGRRTYAIGGNEQATFLSGINVDGIKFVLYMISAACAAVSGIILASRFSSAQPDTGKGWELDAIAAAVIGGTSLAGGSGSVLGVVIGACIMAVLRNGLVLMKVNTYWHISIIGVVIVLAAVLDVKTKRS
jgi:ribose transport system permease protein